MAKIINSNPNKSGFAEKKLNEINLADALFAKLEAKASSKKGGGISKDDSIYNWESEKAKNKASDSAYRESNRKKSALLLMNFYRNFRKGNKDAAILEAKAFLKHYKAEYRNHSFAWQSLSNKENLKELERKEGEIILKELQKFILENKLN